MKNDKPKPKKRKKTDEENDIIIKMENDYGGITTEVTNNGQDGTKI